MAASMSRSWPRYRLLFAVGSHCSPAAARWDNAAHGRNRLVAHGEDDLNWGEPLLGEIEFAPDYSADLPLWVSVHRW